MTTFLLVIIFTVFIGLGIPDSSIGASWPAIFSDLNVDVALQSVVTVIISLGTVTASFFSAKLINKFGTPVVTAVSITLTALALLGFSFANRFIWLCVLGVPLGFGAGAVDAALNNYVAVNYNSLQMSLLHCFYGVGVALTPVVFSKTLKNANDWRTGFFILGIIMLCISVIAFTSLPVWKKVKNTAKEEQSFTPATLKYSQIFKIPQARTAWLIFFSTCALEFSCGTWGATFLVQHRKLTESLSAMLIAFYYAGITSGRFLSGLASKKISCGTTLSIGFSLAFAGIIMFFFSLPSPLYALAFFLIGFGNGPTFPNLTHSTPFIYGKEKSQSIVSMQMVACNLGILIVPPLSSLLYREVSFALFPVVAIISFSVMAISFVVYERRLVKSGMSFYKMH